MLSGKAARLGQYWVGNISFINKLDAMLYAGKCNGNVRWDFNDAVYSVFDWSSPISATLPELYKQRAQQLRDKYDYVSLFYSGGVDSTNILHAFIDNGILLDEIVMMLPKCLASTANKTDLSADNNFSEITFAAIPHLKKYITDNRTRIRIIEIDTLANEFLANELLVTQYHTAFGNMTAMAHKIAISLLDPVWDNLYNSGKTVAHVLGIDKPNLTHIGNNKFSFKFSDFYSYSLEPAFRTAASDARAANQFFELFYWTPDMPAIVIKQCQVLNHAQMTNRAFNYAFTHHTRYVTDYINYLVYPAVVNSVRQLFTTEKPGWDINTRLPGDWFNKSLTASSVGLHTEAINSICKSVGVTPVDSLMRLSSKPYLL